MRVMQSLTGPVPSELGGRVRAVVRAVLEAFGGRTEVQRKLLLGSTGGRGQGVLHAIVLELLTSSGIVTHDRRVHTLTAAQAFVIVHAFAGVLRGVLTTPPGVPVREIEDALVQLLVAPVAKKSG